jgi:hypothetical protein
MIWMRLAAALCLLAPLLVGCGDESAANPDLIRDIAGEWTVDGDPFHDFVFVTDAEPAHSLDFQGEEDFGGTLSQLTGQVEGNQVSFVVDRVQGGGAVAFFGLFTDDDTIHIDSDLESYILLRQRGR